MKLAAPALAAVVLLALAGCAPSTDAAYKSCYDTLSLSVSLDDSLTADEQIEQLADVATLCSDNAKADPAAFNQRWGD